MEVKIEKQRNCFAALAITLCVTIGLRLLTGGAFVSLPEESPRRTRTGVPSDDEDETREDNFRLSTGLPFYNI